MHRFISPKANLNVKSLEITERSELHHLRTVLRLEKGHEVYIFNGDGQEVAGKIEKITPQSAMITITSAVKSSKTRSVSLTLACAIPKKAKFETIIEKCTELGIDRIIPMITERTEFRLDSERQDKKQKRYAAVALNAAKQCKRSILPSVDSVTKFKDLLSQLTSADAAFIPCLAGERKNLLSAFELKKEQTQVIFFIGPEGDFTPQELQAALKAGCIPVTLGPHTLKVDTAAISAIALAELLLEKIA